MSSEQHHQPREPWNKGKLIGQKSPLKLKDIWAIRVRLQLAKRTLDLAMFNPEGVIQRRVSIEMGPVRGKRTNVRTFSSDGECSQLGAILVNDVSACTPGEPTACMDGLALSSRVKNVRLYK